MPLRRLRRRPSGMEMDGCLWFLFFWLVPLLDTMGVK